MPTLFDLWNLIPCKVDQIWDKCEFLRKYQPHLLWLVFFLEWPEHTWTRCCQVETSQVKWIPMLNNTLPMHIRESNFCWHFCTWDWDKTRCFVILIHFKTPILSGKLQYSRKLKMYLSRDGKVFGGISAGTEEFLEVSRPGRKSFLRYLGQDGTLQKRMFLTYFKKISTMSF